MVSDRVDARVRGGVRGRIGLQLCDADTGRVVANVEHENYVAQRMLDVPAEFARFGIVGVENPNNNSANTWMPTPGAFQTAPFTGLVVTDFDGEINLNERGIGGTVVGYASKGVSGQGAQRGTYNAVESEHRFDYHRFVYDFATTEANGTIQSIYTGPWNAAGTLVHGLPEALVPAALTRFGANGNSDLQLALDPASGTVYRTRKQGVGNGQASVATAPLDTLLNEGAVGEWATQTLPTGNFLAIAIVGPRLYWLDTLSGSGGSRTLSVYSAPLTDLQNHRLEHTWDAAFMNSIGWTINSGELTGFTWMPDRETFILGRGRAASAGRPSAALYEFDPNDDWALVRAFNSVGSLTVHNGLSALPGSPDEIMVSTTICRLDNIAGEVTPQGELRTISNDGSSSSELSQGMGVVLGSGSGSTSGRANFIPMQQFFSRARLDEPVVKTSTLTMKITYEFTMDPPVWLP